MDLNSDLGEGFGHWTLGDDDVLLGAVTCGNVACGFHAGDAVARRRISFSCSSNLLRRRSSRSSAESSFPPPRSPTTGGARPSSRSAIFSQRCRQDSEIPKSRAIWAIDASLCGLRR